MIEFTNDKTCFVSHPPGFAKLNREPIKKRELFRHLPCKAVESSSPGEFQTSQLKKF